LIGRKDHGATAIGRKGDRRGPALLRDDIVALLHGNDIEVVAQAQDGPAAVDRRRSRADPRDLRQGCRRFTDEGILVALEARRCRPELAILALPQCGRSQPVYKKSARSQPPR
jgi:hypothetical protein